MHTICNIHCESLSIDIGPLALNQIHQHIRLILSTFPLSHFGQHVQGVFIFGHGLFNIFVPVKILDLFSQITSPECPYHNIPSIQYCCPHLDFHRSWNIHKNYHHSWLWCHCHGYHHISILFSSSFCTFWGEGFALFYHRIYTEIIIFLRHIIL